MELIFEVGNPKRKIITDKEEYLNFITNNNGINNLYETVYKFKYLKTKFQVDYDSAIVDKMFFDCDGKNAWEVAKQFHEYLVKENIKHYMKQSSYMKFHIYPCCKGNPSNKKEALYTAMCELALNAGLNYGRPSTEFDLDMATFGDLARICPIPGTYKPNRKSYCNYITKEDLYDEEKLKEKAKSPGGRKIYYGEEKIDLNQYDDLTKYKNYSTISFECENFKEEFDEVQVNVLPPFIKKILSNYNNYCDDYKNRWRCAIFMRDFGYSEEMTYEICKIYFSKHLNWSTLNGKGTQWDRFEKCKSVHYVYHNQNKYKFPSLYTLKKEGWELEEEDEKIINQLYF